MRNTGLEEAQAGIKIAGRNINNFRYADNTILMAESEEELKSLLMKLKCVSRPVVSNSLQPHGLYSTRILCPWNFPGKSTGVGLHCLLQALTRRTFVGKVMSLLFNMLSRLVITLLLRSKHVLISWLQSPSAMILEPRKIVSHCFHCFPIYLP